MSTDRDAVRRAALEGRNVLPDATDDQAAVIESWASAVLGTILDIARTVHEQKCDHWRGLPLSEHVPDGDPRIAQPFGRPLAMPEHHWRVSPDVMQALTEAGPPPQPIPNPKTADGPTKLLFGWPIDVDRAAPPGTLLLLVTA